MKKIYTINTFVVVLVALFSLVGCGKYGYDFKDGYYKGDSTASEITTDTTMFVADKSLYHRARIFPGLVGENVPRIQDTAVVFNMDFEYISTFDLKVSHVPQPIFSSGLYAPAGENIKIIVPEGVIGLTAQIGVHMDNLTGKDVLRRDEIIYSRKELFPGVNYVKNLYGGTLWILTNIARPQPVSLRIAGAVRAPDFILGESSATEWVAEVENTQVPWVEVRSKRVIFSIPRSLIVNYKHRALNVQEALTEWNEIYEKDFYDWMGLSPNASEKSNRYPDLAERAVLDIQPSAGYAHSGNPWVAQMDQHWFGMFVDRDYILNPNNLDEVSWGAFHELGHNYQQGGTWSWNGLGETTNNLFIWKTANRLNRLEIANHPAIKDAFDDALEYTARTGTKNIVTDKEMNEGSHPFKKILLFLQIYNKAKGKNGQPGWDFMPYIYQNARNVDYAFGLDEAKRDFFYRMLCEFTGENWERFCKAWGINISNLARNEMATLYPPMKTSVWTYNPLTNTGGDEGLPSKYDLDRTEWVATASSYGTGEAEPNGPASNLLDGDLNTFWISDPSAGQPPHTVTFDMKSSEAVKGFYINSRNAGSNIPKAVKIQISTDGVNYRTLTEDDLVSGDFSMLNTANRIEFVLKKSIIIRGFKYIFEGQSHANSNFVGVAEAGAFYDVD